MRTDTTTFAKRVFRDLRAAGLSCAKAKAGRDALVRMARYYFTAEVSDTAVARISLDSADAQTVYIDDDGQARLHAIPDGRFQPLVTTQPTAEQERLSAELVDLLPTLYSAETEEEKAAVNAVYTAKMDAILAINPFVHASIADPDGYEFYHNVYKSEFGFRPRGFITVEAMKKETSSIIRLAEMESQRDQQMAA